MGRTSLRTGNLVPADRLHHKSVNLDLYVVDIYKYVNHKEIANLVDVTVYTHVIYINTFQPNTNHPTALI